MNIRGSYSEAGNSMGNGTNERYRKDGWDYQPVTFWDHIEGREYK